MYHGFLPLSKIAQGRARILLCYPHCHRSDEVLAELSNFNVEGLLLEGPTQAHGFNVLGKGHSSVVVKALLSDGRLAALKIRRSDYNGKGFDFEARALSAANSRDIGPRFYWQTKNAIAMAYVRGTGLVEFLSSASGESIALALRRLISQCYELDLLGISHGQLSDPRRHVIISPDAAPIILDFGKSQLNSSKSNVTAIVQALFLRNPLRRLVTGRLGGVEVQAVLKSLRRYKAERSRDAIEALLRNIKLQPAQDHYESDQVKVKTGASP